MTEYPVIITMYLFQSTLPVRGATRECLHKWRRKNNFNPRSPCGERLAGFGHFYSVGKFQSTLPVRGATLRKYLHHRKQSHFNPRSPCGERRDSRRKAGGLSQFQSTLPVRGATVNLCAKGDVASISIHAPRAGSDYAPETSKKTRKNFNPRSPCGERQQRCTLDLSIPEFQSTLPVRGATGIR